MSSEIIPVPLSRWYPNCSRNYYSSDARTSRFKNVSEMRTKMTRNEWWLYDTSRLIITSEFIFYGPSRSKEVCRLMPIVLMTIENNTFEIKHGFTRLEKYMRPELVPIIKQQEIPFICPAFTCILTSQMLHEKMLEEFKHKNHRRAIEGILLKSNALFGLPLDLIKEVLSFYSPVLVFRSYTEHVYKIRK